MQTMLIYNAIIYEGEVILLKLDRQNQSCLKVLKLPLFEDHYSIQFVRENMLGEVNRNQN